MKEKHRSGSFRVMVALFCAMILSAASGCLAVGIGTAAAGGAVGYAYYHGAVQRAYPVTVKAAARATQDAMAKLGMPLTNATHSEKESTLYFHQGQANGTKIRIWLQQESAPNPSDGVLTVITVRVGTFGDQELTERILDEIARHLSLPSQPGGTGPSRLVPLPSDDPVSRIPQPPSMPSTISGGNSQPIEGVPGGGPQASYPPPVSPLTKEPPFAPGVPGPGPQQTSAPPLAVPGGNGPIVNPGSGKLVPIPAQPPGV